MEILQYDKKWAETFKLIKEVISISLSGLIIDIEHVGSTSIIGLAAKPILDIDIVIEDNSVFPNVISELEKIGYYYQEEWSFSGREVFGRNDELTPWDGKDTHWMEHHLYVCNKDSEELAMHLAFRDYLRNNQEAVIEYENLKKTLANPVINRTSYTSGKSEFISGILKKSFENQR
ncbi:GrpB family protein [Rossellomorea sp. AcN35-11]|nr:GrpB family protein [Rossellomorea aquimaris]WJV31604.1 GrpB family protein [Rossellomorea sp. AcN35-11]